MASRRLPSHDSRSHPPGSTFFLPRTLCLLSVQSAEVTEAEADALEELGLTDASCAAEVIPKDLCV